MLVSHKLVVPVLVIINPANVTLAPSTKIILPLVVGSSFLPHPLKAVDE